MTFVFCNRTLRMLTLCYILTVILIILVTGGENKRDNNVDGLRIRFYNGTQFKENVKFYVTRGKNRPSRQTDAIMGLMGARGFDRKRSTVLYIHGFIENAKEISVKTVVEAYLDADIDCNILLLDWSNMAYGDYFTNAGANVDKVGSAVSKNLMSLVKNGGLLPGRLHLVGHSLGCHIAGSIGRSLTKKKQKVARITCLDPAFPGFYPPFIGKPISAGDAYFVDIIHTDAGHFGTPLPVGHVDFWPNGGYAQQPGCPMYSFIVPVTLDDFCSHRRSWHFYAESVRKPSAFPAVRCQEYAMFKKSECDFSNIGYMGFNAIPELKGAYFMMTNAEPPYGRGLNGLKYKAN